MAQLQNEDVGDKTASEDDDDHLGCTGTVPRRRSSQCFCLKYVAANIDEEGKLILTKKTTVGLELIFWDPSNECRLLLTGNK
ncbi:hypothetical protein pipiens_016156 [Culex pipiens pipiens]|uniref:Uncharacterized protein n=1 Tax=Culex pipiens pipiens TaxID=38569 RepID=A0ABD1CMI1_CULPP